jgi:hypothetical protein
MSIKCYPYPEGLEDRKPTNTKKNLSERLSRMNEREIRLWEQEAHQICLKELIDMRIKPTYLVLNARILAKGVDCDNFFKNSLAAKQNVESTAGSK